jgi:methyl-accepting chemotaxis protein WspA
MASFETRTVDDLGVRDLYDRLRAVASRDTDNAALVLDESEFSDIPLQRYFATALVPTGDWLVIVSRTEDEILAPIRAQMATGISIASGGLIIVVILLMAMAIAIGRRVRQAAEAADRVAGGDLSHDIPPGKGHDETAMLFNSLSTMTRNLRSIVERVKHATIQINATATELAATSQRQEQTAASFGASTSQIAAAVNQISATSVELAGTVHSIDELATGTARVATEGQSGLGQMNSTMESLDSAATSIAGKLAAINERASGITALVTTITKVADQTNLLSVNAAIEAEKAGEAGVGFLVVAGEIRRLADQTAGATLDIEEIVEQMQSAVSAGVLEMDDFGQLVRHGVDDVGRVIGQLGDIIDRVNETTTSFRVVNDGTQSQADGARQISEAMSQLTTDATQTIDSIREFGHAADDLQTAIGSLQESVALISVHS